MPYRNKKLLSLAKDSPVCMVCDNPNDGTVVASHFPFDRDKSMGMKGNDWFIAFACYSCHMKIDQSQLKRSERYQLHISGFVQTMKYLFETGKIKVG